MLRLQPSRIEMLLGEGIVVPPRKHSLQRIHVYEPSNNAWRSPDAFTQYKNKVHSRLSIRRGPRRSREDSLVMYQSEDMHRSYSTESISSNEEEEEVHHTGGRNLGQGTTSYGDDTAHGPNQTPERLSYELSSVKTNPQQSRCHKLKGPSSRHKRRDSVLSETASVSDSDSSSLPVLTSSPCVKLNLPVNSNQQSSACCGYFRRDAQPGHDNKDSDNSAQQLEAGTHQHASPSHLPRQHNRSQSEPQITSLTRHRPKVTPRRRRYVSLDAKEYSQTSPRVFSHQLHTLLASSTLTVESTVTSTVTSNFTESPTSMEHSLKYQTLDGQGASSTRKNKNNSADLSATTHDENLEDEQTPQRTLQKPQAIQVVEVSPSPELNQSSIERSMPRQRSPISSASAEATRNRQSPLDELVREASSHLNAPWTASLPIRDRGTVGLLPGLRFPQFEEPPTSPLGPPSSSSSRGPPFLTPVHQRPQVHVESARRSMPLQMSSSPPVRRPVPDGLYYEPRHDRYPQSQPLPQQYTQQSRFRASTWTPARTSDTPTPATSGAHGQQLPATTYTRPTHQIPRRPLPAHPPIRRPGPSADQENEDWMHRYEQEYAMHQARRQQSARGGVLDETPPREGRLERRLH